MLAARHLDRRAPPGLAAGPVRDALVGDEDTARRQRGARPDRRARTTARSRARQLADDAIAGVVAQAQRPLLATTSRPPSTSASRRRRTASSRASACSVAPRSQGPARRRRLRRLAGQARRARAGRRHRRRRRHDARRASQQRRRVDADQGPAGHRRAPDRACTTASATTKTLTRARSTVPVVASQLRDGRRQEDRRRARCRSSAPARTPRSTPRCSKPAEAGRQGLRARPARQRRRPRRRGAADRQRFLPDGPIVTTRGRNVHEQTLDAHRRRRSSPQGADGRVLVDGDTRVGLGDRHRRAAGPRPRDGRRHAHVRQGRLPGGHRALQRRRARHHRRPVLHAQGPQPRRQRASQTRRRASSPTSRRQGRPEDRADEALRDALRRGRLRRAPSARAPRRAAARRPPRGRRRARAARRAFLGRRAVLRARAARGSTVERSSAAARAPGDLRAACGRRRSQAAARGRIVRACSARPRRRARRDRGADARSRAAAPLPGRASSGRRARRVEHAAAAPRAATCATCRRSRSTRRPRRTSTTRSRAEELGDERWRVWVHIADVSAYVRPGRRRRPRGLPPRRRASTCPGAVEPMLPEALSNDACSLVPGRRPPRGHGRARAATARRRSKAAFYRSLIRSDERLDYDRVDRIFAGAEARAGAVGRAARGRARARRRRSQARAREPRRAGDRVGRARVRLRPRAATSSRRRRRVQTESHRLIEHLMIAANEAVARLLDERAVPDALPRPRAPRAAVRSSACVDAARLARRADAAGARADDAARRRPRSSREASRARRRSTCAAPATAARR